MDKIVVENTYFNIKDTLTCGQVFSYFDLGDKYLIRSNNKFAYVYNKADSVIIETEETQYFYNYFNLQTDYSVSYNFALTQNVDIITKSANFGKGIRILNQDLLEVIISFIISQNNNIKRITSSINYLCEKLGEYNAKFNAYTFPSISSLANAPRQLYINAGLGYRVDYVIGFVQDVISGKIDLKYLATLPTQKLKEQLLQIKGIGEKVANCILLFGFNRQDSFPVDTWIEKVYLQDFKLPLTSRQKMTEYFINTFGIYSGIIQQYLFYYKRNNN